MESGLPPWPERGTSSLRSPASAFQWLLLAPPREPEVDAGGAVQATPPVMPIVEAVSWIRELLAQIALERIDEPKASDRLMATLRRAQEDRHAPRGRPKTSQPVDASLRRVRQDFVRLTNVVLDLLGCRIKTSRGPSTLAFKDLGTGFIGFRLGPGAGTAGNFESEPLEITKKGTPLQAITTAAGGG
jgi:hypothetical protein